MFLMTCLSLLFPLLLILPVLSPCLSSPMSVLTCCVIDVLSLICPVGPTQISHRIILSHFFPRTIACLCLYSLSIIACCFFVTPFYLFFPYHFSITFLLTFRIFDFFPDQGIAFSIQSGNLTIIWVKYNFDKLYTSEINRMQKYLFLMIYVYFFLRSLCSLLPTHINFSWSRQFIQKCLKIARGCFFLPLFANPRIVLNFIPDLYPVVLNCFCLLFFIMVVTSAIITLKLIVFWKLYPSCPFMFTLFCRSHFIWLLSRSCSTNLLKLWRSITRAHIYCNTRLPW